MALKNSVRISMTTIHTTLRTESAKPVDTTLDALIQIAFKAVGALPQISYRALDAVTQMVYRAVGALAHIKLQSSRCPCVR